MSSEYHLLLLPKVMDSLTENLQLFLCITLVFVISTFWLVPGGLAWALSKSRTHFPIPGPPGIPLAGSLSVFVKNHTPHRSLAKLAKRFDASPLMAFSVGFTRFVISSQADTAKEILNSKSFADRPVKESAYELLFQRAMGFAPYGEYWRNLRRISATHMFSPRRIDGSEAFRSRIGLGMASEIRRVMVEKGEIEVRRLLHFASLNSVMMSVFGKCYDFNNGDGVELQKMVSEGYDLLGIFNWSDHFPLLGLFDFQGVRRKSRDLVAKVNVFVGKIIQEHKQNSNSNNNNNNNSDVGDFVDVLLNMSENDKLSDSDMIAVLWEMIFRGTDTVAILLEWILARMVLHPEIQSKAQLEIDSVIGPNSSVTGSHIANMPYLQAIVKETLRVHPPGPLLSWARLAIHDAHVGDKFIPAGTTAMVNMWAITHDHNVWSEPELFKPERFMEEDVSVFGSDLRLAPFGAGRRVCPGKALGMATVHLWLAQLLRSFEWVPSEGGVNLGEVLKLSLEMKSCLVCRAVPRTAVD